MRSLLLQREDYKEVIEGQSVHLCGACGYVYRLVLVRKYSCFSNSRISVQGCGASSWSAS